VEQTIGRWKRRFHALHGELRLSLKNIPRAIVAAAVLHNIAIKRNLPHFDGEEDNFVDDQPVEIPFLNERGRNVDAYRNIICENYFN